MVILDILPSDEKSQPDQDTLAVEFVDAVRNYPNGDIYKGTGILHNGGHVSRRHALV